jgi:hypothetical protein
MVIKSLLIVVIIAILMDDSSSIRKTEEEKREEKELAELVNKTLAEEKKKEDEEKRREDEKRKKNQTRTEKGAGQVKETGSTDEKKDQDEACPTLCPEQKTCPEVHECSPCEDCPQIEECRPCPKERECPSCEECPEERPCRPCGPCPVGNSTRGGQELPIPPSCPEPSTMTVPVAMAVGACASLLLTGVATAIGLLLRYAPPIFSGLLFLSIVVLTWYLSSHYPETARELGRRVVTTLREATVALGHRVVEAIQRHNEQVGFPVLVLFFLFSDLSSMFI